MFVVGAADKPRWVDSELDQFKGDLSYYLRGLSQPVIRLIESKAKRNPVSRRHKVFDPDRSTAVTVDGNDVQAFGFELADYALLDAKGVAMPNPNFDPTDPDSAETIEAKLTDTVLVEEGNEQVEKTVKDLMLENIDVQNEVVKFARRIANTSEETERKNARR